MDQKECKYCGRLFRPNRTDKKYCTDLCRYKFKYRNNLYKEAIENKKEQIQSSKNELHQKKKQLKHFLDKCQRREKEKADLIKQEKDFKKSFSRLLSLSKEKQIKSVFLSLIQREKDPGKKEYLREELKFAETSYKLHVVNEYIKEKEETLKEIEEREQDRRLDLEWLTNKGIVEKYETEIKELEKKIEKLQSFDPKIELPERKKSSLGKKKPNGLSSEKRKGREFDVGQIRKMDFSSYRIPGELGSFLGELDDNKIAIALTGDSGAGKSYFSFELAKLFADYGKTVKYFSLEEGIAKITKNKLDQYEIESGIVFTDTGTLEDIDEDAERFEVIIIDSFGKISNRQQEFDLLRHKHPKTIFIIIFQKTTAKTIKGGAGIKYDSSATINVVEKPNKERVAIMEKCRYGTQYWVYSITQQRIISQG